MNLRLLPFVPVLALVGSAAAASPPVRDGEVRRLDEVQVTATRRAEATLEVPVAVTVVGRDEIRALGAQTVMDALHGQPGTFVQQTTPGQAVVIVRGLKGSEVLHLVDGFRLNNAIFRNAPNQYVALVDSQMLERIEVVRGPMSTLYGGDAMGGVVQMLSWNPRFEGGDWQRESGLRAQYASTDRSLLTRVDGAVGNQTLVLSGGLTYQNTNTLRVGGGERVPFTDFIARGGDAKAVWTPAAGHEVLLQAQHYEQPKTPRVDELVPGFGQARPNSSTFLFAPQVRSFQHARWRIDVSTPLFDRAEVHLGHQRIRDDRRARDFGTVNEDRERNTVDTEGLTFKAEWSLSEAHYLTYGVEWYRDEVASFRDRLRIDTGTVSVRPPRFPDGSTQHQVGVFVADDWHITDRLDLVLGLRWSRVETELPPAAGTLGTRIADNDLSGNVGVNFALSDGLRLVANAGRGFRAPNVFDLGTFGDRPGNRFNIPNPDLKPETVFTVDAGVKFDHGAWSGELIAWRSSYEDKITSLLTGEVLPNGRLIAQSRNATELDLSGFEAGLEWRPSESARLFASATTTRGDERLAGDEYPADRIPPLFGKIGASWRWREDVELEAYAFYAAEQDRLSPRDLVDPRINPAGTPGWSTINARLGWQPSERLSMTLRLENLGDRRYREHGSGLDEPGRSAIVLVDWRF
ncbi:MAG: TonB-dependent receptor plug domain-containing protein [Pseudomonadota bacterium]